MSTTARSETRHTEEPWQVDDGDSNLIGVFDENGEFICYMAEPFPTRKPGYRLAREFDVNNANAARIVACVNGCVGVADPSAVPELLAGVQQLLTWANRVGVAYADPITRLRSSLAHARGVAPGGEGGTVTAGAQEKAQ